MIPYWIHNNNNMKLYIIHVEILNYHNINNCEFYYYKLNKWVKYFRTLSPGGDPCCKKL